MRLHKAKDINLTLSNLPTPEYAGQRIKMPVFREPQTTTGLDSPKPRHDDIGYYINLEAYEWNDGNRAWLEWMISI